MATFMPTLPHRPDVRLSSTAELSCSKSGTARPLRLCSLLHIPTECRGPRRSLGRAPVEKSDNWVVPAHLRPRYSACSPIRGPFSKSGLQCKPSDVQDIGLKSTFPTTTTTA